MTKVGARFRSLVQQFRKSNPIKQLSALSSEDFYVANPRRKKRSPKQIAATNRMIKARKRKLREAKAGRRVWQLRKKRKSELKKKKRAPKAAPKVNPIKKKANPIKSAPAARKPNPTRKKRKKPVAKKRTTRRRAAPKRRRRRRRNPSTTATATATRTANPRRRRRRKKAVRRRRRRNPATAKRTTTRRRNAWYGNSRGHRRAAKSGWRCKKKRKVCRRRRSRRRNPVAITRRRANPVRRTTNPALGRSYGSLMGNPVPVSYRSIKALGVVGLGVGLGLVVADGLDRYVATRTPADAASGAKGIQPWYGRNAVAAQQRKPDAVRLGAQAAGGVVSLAGAYAARRVKVLPWVLSGTAIGFAANLAKQLVSWYLMPKVLEVKEDGEQTLANRLYPLEQDKVQDEVDKLFDEQWDNVADLLANQQEKPQILSPLSASTNQNLYTLGEGEREPEGLPLGVAGRPSPFVRTGRVGMCAQCGGMNGCYNTCPDAANLPCDTCDESGEGTGEPRCAYVVQPGDDIHLLATAAGVDIAVVNDLNGGPPESYWTVGAEVVLPYALCLAVQPKLPPGPEEPGLVVPLEPDGEPLLPVVPTDIPIRTTDPRLPLQPERSDRPPPVTVTTVPTTPPPVTARTGPSATYVPTGPELYAEPPPGTVLMPTPATYLGPIAPPLSPVHGVGGTPEDEEAAKEARLRQLGEAEYAE